MEPRYSASLTFSPICLTFNYGLVVAGGEDGELAIFNIHERSLVVRELGGSMNNSVEIIFHQGVQKLVIANNDGTISIYTLPKLVRERIIGPFPAAVNASKMSPDGKCLAVVGDFPEVFVVPITENGFERPFALLPGPDAPKEAVVCGPAVSPIDQKREESRDHQYIAWNLTSTLVAVTSDTQKYVTVWHLPSRTITLRIEASHYTFPIQFSMMKPDLLVFANRRGFVHLINVATRERQIIGVPAGAKINGFCFSVDFRQLYVALPSRIVEYTMNGTKTLMESCISVLQAHPPTNVDWRLVPRELVIRLFPYNNLEVGIDS